MLWLICTVLIEKGTLFDTMLIGGFKVKDMYERIFGDDEKLQKFLRWRVQVLERGIKLLHFTPGALNSIIQVTDLKDMPKRELRVASNHILSLFQANYPEMVARKVKITFLKVFSAFFILGFWILMVLFSVFSFSFSFFVGMYYHQMVARKVKITIL